MNNYDRYKAMSSDQLLKLLKEQKITIEYLNWLGVAGPGKQLRESINE